MLSKSRHLGHDCRLSAPKPPEASRRILALAFVASCGLSDKIGKRGVEQIRDRIPACLTVKLIKYNQEMARGEFGWRDKIKSTNAEVPRAYSVPLSVHSDMII